MHNVKRPREKCAFERRKAGNVWRLVTYELSLVFTYSKRKDRERVRGISGRSIVCGGASSSGSLHDDVVYLSVAKPSNYRRNFGGDFS